MQVRILDLIDQDIHLAWLKVLTTPLQEFHHILFRQNDVLDFVWSIKALTAQLPEELFVGHLPIEQVFIESKEILVVL